MGLENSGIAIIGDSIKVNLLQEVRSVNEVKSTEETALYFKTKGTGNRDKQRKCTTYNCGKPGHFAAKCKAKIKHKQNEERNIQQKTFLTVAIGEQKDTAWYLSDEMVYINL